MASARYLAIGALLLAIDLASVLEFAYPPLVDYPNHLARMHILLHPDDPVLARFYGIDWVFSPNLALDAFVRASGGWLGAAASMKIFLLLSMILLGSAPLFLSYCLFGRVMPGSLAAFLFVHTHALQLGLLSFLFGCGLALWFFGFSLLLLRARRWVYLALGTVMATILLLAHLYGFALYAALVGVHALSRVRELGVSGLAARAAQFVLPVGLFLALSPTASASVFMRFDPLIKFTNLSNLFMFGDAYSYGLATLVAVVGGILLVKHGVRMFHRDMVAVVAALLGLYAILPPWLMSSANADWRLLVPTLFVACGALAIPLRSRRTQTVYVSALVLLTSAQALVANDQWRKADAFQREMIARVRSLEPGARIFPAFFGKGPKDVERPIAWTHLASFAVIEKAAFLPSLFAFGTQQPLSYRGDYETIRQETDRLLYEDPESVDWEFVRDHFDYVFLMDPRGEAGEWQRRIPLDARPVDGSGSHIRVLALGPSGTAGGGGSRAGSARP